MAVLPATVIVCSERFKVAKSDFPLASASTKGGFVFQLAAGVTVAEAAVCYFFEGSFISI